MNEQNYAYLGGYFLVAPIKDEKLDYVPKEFFTVSECISDIFPSNWAWSCVSNKEQKGIIKELRITESDFLELRNWVERATTDGSFGYPHVFSDVLLAREFYRKYLSNIHDVKLLGIGISKQYFDEFLDEVNDAEYGVFNNLTKRRMLDNEGVFRGFELLGYESWSFHTQYCHSNLINYVQSNLHIKFNENGLFKDYEEADSVIKLIRNNKIGAEPALWQPWTIFEYKL